MMGRHRNPIIPELATLLRERADARGIRRNPEIARSLNVHYTTIYKWENGQMGFPPRRMGKICSVYGVSPEEVRAIVPAEHLAKYDFTTTVTSVIEETSSESAERYTLSCREILKLVGYLKELENKCDLAPTSDLVREILKQKFDQK